MNADPLLGAGGTPPARPIGFARATALAPYAPAPAPTHRESHADPRKLLTILWRRRWIFVACLATAVLLATVLTLIATPLFKAATTLEINQPEAQINTGPNEDQQVAVRDPQFLTTQLGLLKSEALADRVARDPAIATDAGFV